MQFLHKRMHLNAGDTVVVDCSHQCNILLMTDTNFNNYRNARSFHHHGGGGFFRDYRPTFMYRIQVTGILQLI
ncbi:DUF1883 domain-containing protein [Escherichia coli]|nr:DUF1883 domain-containing protein [Escherichia coli]